MAEKKKKNKLVTYSLMFFGLLLASVIITLFIMPGGANNLSNPTALFADGGSTFMLVFGMGFLLLLLYILSGLMKSSDSSGGASVKTKGDVKKYFDSHWVTDEDLRKKSEYMFTMYSDLNKVKKAGIPIRAEMDGKKMYVNMYKPIHTLVIGTTGSGKSQCFVHPTIQILSDTAQRPSIVVTDPKGELYDFNCLKLEKRGYRVMVFDLRDPFSSTCWNPLSRAYDIYHRALNLEKEILVHRGDSPKDFPKLKLAHSEYYPEWYEFDGIAFADINTVKSQIAGMTQQLKAAAIKELKDIAITLCPIKTASDPIWEGGAQDFLWATLIAMLEDSENPALGMTRERFNFYNLAKICNTKDSDPFNPSKTLDDYFQGRDPLSQATQISSQVVTAPDTTKKSYMSFVANALNIFSDLGIAYATHTNEMNLAIFDDQPTALFIKIPDEETTRYPIATMFISQLYKILVDIANKRPEKCLKNTTYFLLDEFANMPKIENFETIITVARSREIFFVLIVQSYAQLAIKYDEKVASTIKDNCNIHVYIASNDPQTQKEFSERCGNITVETESKSTSKGKKEEGSSTTTSVNIDTRPLIYPAELATLKDKMLISILREHPLKVKFDYAYKVSQAGIYDMQKKPSGYTLPKALNERELFYDIKERNKVILQKDKAKKPTTLDDFEF